MPIGEYVWLARKGNVDAKYHTSKLVALAWGLRSLFVFIFERRVNEGDRCG